MKNFSNLLRELHELESTGNKFEAYCDHNDTSILVRINLGSDPKVDVIDFTNQVVESLPDIVPATKQIIVRDLCQQYNESWNVSEEMQADGTYKRAIKPVLTPSEFASKFTLKSISISGVTGIEFWFNDSNLFWGY